MLSVEGSYSFLLLFSLNNGSWTSFLWLMFVWFPVCLPMLFIYIPKCFGSKLEWLCLNLHVWRQVRYFAGSATAHSRVRDIQSLCGVHEITLWNSWMHRDAQHSPRVCIMPHPDYNLSGQAWSLSLQREGHWGSVGQRTGPGLPPIGVKYLENYLVSLLRSSQYAKSSDTTRGPGMDAWFQVAIRPG